VDVPPVLVDVEPVKVTKNLESFLQHARVPFSGLMLWIDALCINQQSIEERNHQVLLMGKIYAGARKVIVWLGHGDTAISQLFCRLDRTNGSPFAAGGPQDLPELSEAAGSRQLSILVEALGYPGTVACEIHSACLWSR